MKPKTAQNLCDDGFYALYQRISRYIQAKSMYDFKIELGEQR
jgi:hypothetical protein